MKPTRSSPTEAIGYTAGRTPGGALGLISIAVLGIVALCLVAVVAGPAGRRPGSRALAASEAITIHLPLALDVGAPRRAPDGPAPTVTAPGPTAEPTASGQPTDDPSPTSAPRPPASFAAYVPVDVDVVPNAPEYVPDLERVANRWLVAGLGEPAQRALERQGFVVIPARHKQFHELYSQGRAASIPPFVTTDALLHTYHVLYSAALREAEQDRLMDELRALTTAMLGHARRQAEETTGPVRTAAAQSVGFFAVAARLLDPDAHVPSSAADVVAQELSLIAGHAGVFRSPLFGYDEDYSQYVPRGHYARNEAFQRYFRAMMWYGHMAFRLDPGLDAEVRRRETRAALLIAHGLHTAAVGDQTALELWDRIYDVTAFFVGTADDLTVHDYAEAARAVYVDLPTPADLADEERLDRFIAAARELRPPAILNTPLRPGQDRVAATMGFRFMGQCYIPDSAIFQQLVYDHVQGSYRGEGRPFTEHDSKRSFPRALDVPAALGSARALEILTAAGDADYDGYDQQLALVAWQFADLDPERWSSNLYWSWLDSLRPLLVVPGEGFPFFMRTIAWIDKSLGAWLGSWSQLRHDTILYAKPSMPAATGVPSDPEGYVEPNPWLYARLAALCAQMRSGLLARGLLAPEPAQRLDRMQALLLDLKTISELELVGAELDAEQRARIRDIAGDLQALARPEPDAPKSDQQIAVVADVHSVPAAGLALEEGVGDAFEIYVIVPQPGGRAGEQTIARGGVFSYYEFKWPISDRLTDEAWQAMDPKPPLPDWMASYLVAP